MSVGGRLGSSDGRQGIDLVSIPNELLPGDDGGLAGAELDGEHLAVAGFENGGGGAGGIGGGVGVVHYSRVELGSEI